MIRLAVVGVTRLVGTKMLETTGRKHTQFGELVLFSSVRSTGKEIGSQGKTYTIQELTEEAASGEFDYVPMNAGDETSKESASIFEKAGVAIIDNSNQWRMANDVDLIIPEANRPEFKRGIIANPDCSTTQSVVPFKTLYDAFGLERTAYTTYQAVSDSGIRGKRDLAEGANDKALGVYPYPIYNNVLPHIDVFLEDGCTKGEQKMTDETRKTLGQPGLRVTATCTRIPVQDSHSVEIDIIPNRETTIQETRNLFESDNRVVLVDNPEDSEYPLTINSTDEDEMFVGRIRHDDSLDNIFHVWCTPDNLLKGATLNTTQMLEQVIRLEGAR